VSESELAIALPPLVINPEEPPLAISPEDQDSAAPPSAAPPVDACLGRPGMEDYMSLDANEMAVNSDDMLMTMMFPIQGMMHVLHNAINQSTKGMKWFKCWFYKALKKIAST
jgi:hypothetical protein